jgi:hypothetical protein
MAEDLEGRRLLSGGAAAPVIAARVTAAVANSTVPQRNQRIERLPVHLSGFDPGRALPAEVTGAIQAELYALVGTMTKAKSKGLQAFNEQLRGVLKSTTISPAQAGQMSGTFGRILASAGADPARAEGLQAAMNELVRVNASTSNRSAFLTANDYSLVLQVALAVGRPLQAPKAPKLAAADDTPPRGDRATRVAQPTLVGSYNQQATMQITDLSGATVFGSARTAPNGAYSVRFSEALAPGTYQFRMRALGLQGGQSRPGKAFTLTILAPQTKR